MYTYCNKQFSSIVYDNKDDRYYLLDGQDWPVLFVDPITYRMNPYLRSIPLGKHRRSLTTHYSYPLGQSGADTSGRANLTATQSRKVSPYAVPFGTSPLASALVQQQMDQMIQAMLYSTVNPPILEKPIKHEGIVSGEIIAYRGWVIKGNRLYSIYKSDHCWEPNKPMTGEIVDYGVHAFKDWHDVTAYCRDDVTSYVVHHGYIRQYILGRTALWGEVVEHERGYRAENAKIVSLNAFYDPIRRLSTNSLYLDHPMLDILRKEYNV